MTATATSPLTSRPQTSRTLTSRPLKSRPLTSSTVRRLLRVTADEAGGWSAATVGDGHGGPAAGTAPGRARGSGGGGRDHRRGRARGVDAVASPVVRVEPGRAVGHRERLDRSAGRHLEVSAQGADRRPLSRGHGLDRARRCWSGAVPTATPSTPTAPPTTRPPGSGPSCHPSPLAARSDATSVWTGKYLFIWGGGGPSIDQQPDGALYDPAAVVGPSCRRRR